MTERKNIENNIVHLRGTFDENLQIDCKFSGEKFCRFFLNVSRKSGTVDRIPILISNDFSLISYKRKRVEVKGKYCSYHQDSVDGKRHLILDVVAESIEYVDEKDDYNEVILEGHTSKSVIYRRTPLGKEIVDMILAVKNEGHSRYFIPCIAWGTNAVLVANFPVDTHLKVAGRIQSREYQKKQDDGSYHTKTAYEVAIFKLEVIE